MITAEDVFQALKELDFEKYEEPLREFLKNYNAEKEDIAKKNAAGKKLAPIQDNGDINMGTQNDLQEDEGDYIDDEGNEFKRIKTD